MSELVTNKITPGTGSSDTVTLGDSGDTFTIPAGVTLAGSGASLTALPAANLTGTTAIANGGTGVTAVGTSGNVLTSTGSAWASTALPASGGWVFVSQVASGGSPPTTMSFTNMVAGYDYLYVTGPMLPSSDAIDFWYYLGVAGPTYRTSGYLNGSGNVGSGGTSVGTANTTEMMINDGNGPAVGSATDEGIQFMETILLNPAGTTDTHVHTVCSYRDNTGAYNQCNTGGLLNLAEAHTSIKFNFTAGTMTGTILQYRRSRT